jgi:hypothetical protein
MKNPAALLLVPFLALVVSACSGGGGGGTGGSGGSVACSGTTLTAIEANNYAFTSTLTVPPVTVKPGVDLTFDWGSVTKDFLGHSVTPKTDLKTILVMMWKLNLADLQTKLNADSLLAKDMPTIPLNFTTDGSSTSSNLLSFSNTGAPTAATILSFLNPVDYPPADYTYTLMASTAPASEPGTGVKMIQSFQLDTSSQNTNVKMTTDSTKLTYTANLHSLTPTGVPAGQAAITLDWGNMTTNALGAPFITTNITQALVGQYTQSPAELEGQFLDLELIASKLYRGTIDIGTIVDFSALKTDSGENFSGISTTGTWLVALQCGGCRNPAPWYLSILKPCS